MRAALGLALLLGAGGCAGPDAPAARPHVLLITIDTLRADRLGSYGYHLPTSPTLDRLAARGVRFTDCTVQWPQTWPSMASMLTGAYPKTIGMQYERRVMPPSHLLMGELFQAAGYRTGAVVSNFNIGMTFGFDQGFDRFVESWRQGWIQEAGDAPFENRPGKVKSYTNAAIVTDQALEWLRQSDPARPFFLWLHYMEPHGPYVPPAEYASLFAGDYPPEPTPATRLPGYQVQSDPQTGRPIADLAHYRAQYDREVRYLDDEIARLFAELESMGVDSRELLVVFSADHGESFNEHGYYLDHGQFSYQPSAHVPLIVAREGSIPEGRVVDDPVGLIDAAATVLDLAGLAIPATFEGQTLAPLIDGADGARGPEYVFMEAGFHERTQITVRHRQWKLIRVRDGLDRRRMAGPPYELYDVLEDPGETNNLFRERREVVSELSRVLDEWYAGGPRWQHQGEKIPLDSLAPEELEMLRSLGYVE